MPGHCQLLWRRGPSPVAAAFHSFHEGFTFPKNPLLLIGPGEYCCLVAASFTHQAYGLYARTTVVAGCEPSHRQFTKHILKRFSSWLRLICSPAQHLRYDRTCKHEASRQFLCQSTRSLQELGYTPVGEPEIRSRSGRALRHLVNTSCKLDQTVSTQH